MYGIDNYMRNEAHWVWEEQSTARHHGLRLQEETITESLLLRIAKDWQGHGMAVKMFNRTEEGGSKRSRKAGNGADWEWFVRTPACKIGFRIQAKVLSSGLTKNGALSVGKYEGLHNDRMQTDALITEAKAIKFNPLYVFYNHSWVSDRALFSAASHPFPVREGDWGCSVAKAAFVKTTKGNNLRDLARGMLPWHHVFAWRRGGACATRDALNSMAGDQAVFETSPEPDWLKFFELPPERSDDGAADIDQFLKEKKLRGVALFDFLSD